MTSIQEELFSEDQWLQFINEYEKESQPFIALEEINTSLNSFTNTECLAIPYSEQGSLNPMLGWTYQDTAHLSSELQTDYSPDINLNLTPSAYKELKALYARSILFRVLQLTRL